MDPRLYMGLASGMPVLGGRFINTSIHAQFGMHAPPQAR